MSRNGSGVYSLPAGNPVVTGTTISSSWANTTLSDIATALTGSVASDGQTAMTGNLQMGSNKVTGLAVATATGDALSYGQAATVTTLTTTGNVTIGGTLTLTGGLTLNGNVTVGDSSSDTLTINATITSNLIFTDNTYDIGASGATRPRNFYLSGNEAIGGNSTITGTLGVTGTTTLSGALAANGGVTLGDASGDSLTINSSAVSIPNGLNFDSNTFVIDATNNTVGLGTASPAQRLHVVGNIGLNTGVAAGTNGFGLAIYASDFPRLTLRNSTTGDTTGDGLQVYMVGSDVSYNLIESGYQRWLTADTERMRITSAGNVGIGTSSPSAATITGRVVDIVGSGPAGIRAYSGGVGVALIYNTGAETSIGGVGDTTAYLTFKTGNLSGTERMRLDSSGNLGLGVTPKAWNSTYKTMQLGVTGFLYGRSGNELVSLGSNGYVDSGSTWRYAESGNTASYYQQSSGIHYWYNAPSGTAGDVISFTERMRLDTSGNLGIGTTSPQARLVSAGSSSTVFKALLLRNGDGTDGSSATIDFETSGGTQGSEAAMAGRIAGLRVSSGTSGALTFSTTNAGVLGERMRIDSSGNLLVGTTDSSSTASAGFKFKPAQGGSNAPTVCVVTAGSTGSTVSYQTYSTGAGAYRFYVDNAGSIYATSTSITAISDASLKENVKDLETGLTEIMALKPRRFDWKNGDATNVAGFIAQEVAEVLPELVLDYQYNDDETKKALKMGDMLPTLVKAIQELKAEVDSLKAQLNK